MLGVNLARKLAISTLSLVIVFLASELIARWAEPGPMSLFDQRPYVKINESVHEHKPNFVGRWDGTWYEINSKGMRGPEYEPEYTDEEYRVVAIGDSCTFGKGVLEEDTWPRQLERLLQAEMPDRKVMVANLGVNGYASTHYRRMFMKKGLREQPHLVVIGFNINDFPNITARVDKEVFQGKKSLRSRIPGPIREGLGGTAIFRWLRSTWYHMNREKDWAAMERVAAQAVKGLGPESTGESQRVVRDVLEAAQDSGAEVGVFLFPYESMVYLDSYNDSPGKRLERIVERFDIPVVGVSGRFREEVRKTDPPVQLFLRGDRYHPNAKGYTIVAEALVEELLHRN
jgi:lysophospholipase L1-like esterase